MLEYFDHIEDYKQGRLSEADLLAFEAELVINADLRSAVDNYELAKEISLGYLEEEVRAVLNEKVADKKPTFVQKWNQNFTWRSIAATLFVLVIGGAYLFNNELISLKDNNNPITFSELLVDPVWPIERGVDDGKLSKAIIMALDGYTNAAVDSLKQLNLPIEIRNYWIAEVFTKAMMSDSALFYLPEANGTLIRRDRIHYLDIINLYQLKKYHLVNQRIAKLPDDTDEWYIKLYEKLGI